MVKEEHVAEVRRIARKLDIKLEPGSGMSPCEESKGFSSQGGGVIVIEDDDLSEKDRQNEGAGEKEANGHAQALTADVLSSIQTVSKKPAAAAAAAAVDTLLAQQVPAVNSSVTATLTRDIENSTANANGPTDRGPLSAADVDSCNNEHSCDSISQPLPPSAENNTPADDEDEEDTSSFIPSIKQVIKEAVSRRKKSIPRKVIKDTVVATTSIYSIAGDKIAPTPRPQIAEVMPTPIMRRPSHTDTPLSQSPSSTSAEHPPNAKYPKLDGIGGGGGIFENSALMAPGIINIMPESSGGGGCGVQLPCLNPASIPVSLPVSLPDLTNMQGLMTAAPFLNLNPAQLFSTPGLQNLQLDAATAQLLTAQLLPNMAAACAANSAGAAPGINSMAGGGMVYLPTAPSGLPGSGAPPGVLSVGLGSQPVVGLGGQGNQWVGSVGNQGALAGGERKESFIHQYL